MIKTNYVTKSLTAHLNKYGNFGLCFEPWLRISERERLPAQIVLIPKVLDPFHFFHLSCRTHRLSGLIRFQILMSSATQTLLNQMRGQQPLRNSCLSSFVDFKRFYCIQSNF